MVVKGLEGETIQAQPINLQRVAEKSERLKGFWGIKNAYREAERPYPFQVL